MKKIEKYFFLLAAFFTVLLAACGEDPEDRIPNHVVMSVGFQINTLDPALAADSPTLSVCSAFYDTLIQYRYNTEDQSILEGAMLAKLPELQQDGKTYLCTLREDLLFQESPAFSDRAARRVTSDDVIFSLKRLADARLHSPGYDIVRDLIAGIDDFYERTKSAAKDDFSVYDTEIDGLRRIDDLRFLIVCKEKNPRALYLLAMPNCAIVSRRAVEYYGNDEFGRNPCGSGPYKMIKWKRDHSVVMERYEDYRLEYLPDADDPAERSERLPLADRITCYLVRQGVSSWLMFLQGKLDLFVLDNEQFQALVDDDLELAEPLQERQIRLLRAPLMETNYIGFNFNDPVLGNNAALRMAISLAFDKELRVLQSGGRFTAAFGPVPPGMPGNLKTEEGLQKNIEMAKKMMTEAGYPGGIDPATGKPLVLTFDQPGTDTLYQQNAEMFQNDMKKIGIEVRTMLNTRPRFQEKLKSGDIQLFRYSWVGDYPDAENFLKLFYSRNAGGSNRVCYNDPVYDQMYEEVALMPDSPARSAKYEAMARYLLKRAPWIFETHTMAFVVTHSWLKNYRIHNFTFNRWKYLSAPSRERVEMRKKFKPLKMSELH